MQEYSLVGGDQIVINGTRLTVLEVAGDQIVFEIDETPSDRHMPVAETVELCAV